MDITPLSQAGLDLAPFEDTFRFVAFLILRFAAFTAHALIFGVPVLSLLVLRPAFRIASVEEGGPNVDRVAHRLEGFVQAGLVASAVAAVAAVFLQALLVADLQGGDITGDVFSATLESSFARWQVARLPIIAALAVMLVGRVRSGIAAGAADDRRPAGAGWWGAWLVLGGLLFVTTAYSGHSAVATPRVVAIANDVLHLAFGAVWFGGIVALAIALPEAWRGRGPATRLRVLTPAVVRFSTVAAVSVAVLAVTGTLNSFLHVGAVNDLVDSNYGRTLAVKVTLFGAVLALGALNHFVIRKRLERAVEGQDDLGAAFTFRRTIAAELVVGLVLMGVTGALVGLARTKPIVVEESEADGVTSAPRP